MVTKELLFHRLLSGKTQLASQTVGYVLEMGVGPAAAGTDKLAVLIFKIDTDHEVVDSALRTDHAVGLLELLDRSDVSAGVMMDQLLALHLRSAAVSAASSPGEQALAFRTDQQIVQELGL